MCYKVKISDTIRGIEEEQDFNTLIETLDFINMYKEDGVTFFLTETTENKFKMIF